jgi:hypothetical protein
MIILQATQDIRKVSLWLGHATLTRLHQLAGCGGANWLKLLERDIKSRHYSL